MKKRRVLALLLALSLAVSTNGMTVLATEGDMPAVSVSIEETAGEAIGSEIPADDQQTDGSVEGSETDGQEQGELPGGEDNAGNPDGDGDSQDQNDGDAVEIPDADENGDLLNGEEESAEPEDKVDSEEQEEVEEEADGELSDDEVPEIRMMTFTDDTGFKITYNAVQATSFTPNVSNGVLTGIPDAEGVVDLREETTITEIGANAFKDNAKITYVMLPSSVTKIQNGAFQNCNKLQGIYLPAKMETIGVSAFEQCRSLVKIAIPKAVTSIGDRAFYQDDKLFMVYMKDADYSELTSIGDEAFYECKALVQFCSDTAFVIPGKLQTIGARAFSKCESITEVDLNESVTTMGDSVFEDCSSLKSVTLSSLLQDIPKAAFKGCNNLVRVIFKMGNKTIGESAFEGCFKLGGVELVHSINKIENHAFKGCTKLVSAEIPNGETIFGDSAFPKGSSLTLIGPNYTGSTVLIYADNNNNNFVGNGYKDQSSYYLYDVLPTGTGSGNLTVKDKDGKDPNTLHNNQGVAYNTKLYVYYTPASGSALVTGSVKCNGVPLNKDSNGVYYFTMPIGGALITAEFVTTSNSKQTAGGKGDITVEMSNGDIVTAEGEVKEIALKVGQSSRMFLIDTKDGNKAIDSGKITYTTDNKAVATVSNTGMIQAVKVGNAKVKATVKCGDGTTFTGEIRVSVTTSDVAELKVKATSYDASKIKLTTSASDDVQSATVDKNSVKQALTFKIKATAYDADADDMAVALKWATSDAKVAKISSTSTTAASPINTVTIPANTDGEATITVTATNADKTTITQKFIVSVKDYTPRLVSGTLTVNPNLEDGALLEIVSAYEKAIDNKMVKLMYSDNSIESTDFVLTPVEDEDGSNPTVSRFRVSALQGVAAKTYTVNVDIGDGAYSIPLKITVKSTQPSPKVAFEKNQPKLDLFKKKDETPVNVVVSNLGNDLVSEYSLEPLSDSDDDKLFTENFKVEYVDGSHCKITQKITEENDSMQFTSKNKAAVTGYLVLKYEGYKDTITKKFKITIPTQTVTPSFKLDRTADTYYADCDAQEITLQLLDKKNKNLPVDLSKDGYHVQVTTGSGFTRAVTKCEITDDGNIKMPMTKNPDAGKVYLEVTNDSWAEGKKFSYVYTIKTTSSTPTISLKSSTVTMNSRYKEQEAVFELKSNLKDTDIAEDQTFEMPAKLNAKTQAEYEKLSVDYSDGIGTVSIDDPTIANGTYSFVCNNAEYEYKGGRRKANKVTLKVKVTNGVPTVTAKGTLAFNTRAVDDQEKNVEESELTFTTKNLPEKYVFDKEATLGSIACTTKNCSEYAEYFDWDLVDGKLKVSMKDWCPAATYKFTVTPTFAYNGPEAADSPNSVSAKALSFNVKVYSGSISVTLASKGKLNLLDRKGECTTNNSIVYTPTFKNLKDTVDKAEIYDVTGGVPSREDEQSKFFDVTVSSDGKLYVTPKPGAQLDNNKTYKVMIWLQPKNYTYGPDEGGLWYNKVLSIKTAQILPKAATDKSTVNLYLSNKSYEATFIVNKKDAKAIGSIESIAFGEKDTKAQESFVTMYDPVTEKNILIQSEQQKDGSLKVTLKLRDTVSYACNSTNKLTMYVKFEGQGSNTAGTAITMNVKINK